MKIMNFDCSGMHLSRLLQISLASLMYLTSAGSATAADHSVSSTVSSLDCSSVAPGDTVTLAAGTRGSLVVNGCAGTSSRPIVIRNDPAGKGPTVISRSSGNAGGFVLSCNDCEWTQIDGSGKWVGAPSTSAYGIKVTMVGGGSPTAFLRVGGLSRFVTIRGIEIDGKWPSLASDGIGISVNDHAIKAASYPGRWREGIVIEDNYVHDVEGEGLYVGSNWGAGDLPLRDVKISRNLVEDTGWDGINLKSTVGGGSEISGNVVRRGGKRNDADAGQHAGIALFEGGAKIYNNWVEDSGESGTTARTQNLPASYGAQVVEIFNNVVVNSGVTGPLDGNGIATGGQSSSAPVEALIYSNTVVGAEGIGIKSGAPTMGGLIRDNIVVDAAGSAVSAASGVQVSNNLVGTMEKIGFVDGTRRNFRLQATSVARDAGSSRFPSVDHDNVPRPQGGAADQGAFEFQLDEAVPKPPQAVVVE